MALIHGGIILIRYGWRSWSVQLVCQPQYIYVYQIIRLSTQKNSLILHC